MLATAGDILIESELIVFVTSSWESDTLLRSCDLEEVDGINESLRGNILDSEPLAALFLKSATFLAPSAI